MNLIQCVLLTTSPLFQYHFNVMTQTKPSNTKSHYVAVNGKPGFCYQWMILKP